MDSKLQYAESVKYIAKPLCIIPHEDGTFTLFSGFAGRRLIGNYTEEDFLNGIRENYKVMRNEHDIRAQEREQIQQSKTNLLDELGI